MRGALVQRAESGGFGMSICQTAGFGTNIVKPIDFPSGDQWMSAGDSVRWVIWVGPGSPSARYAIRVPSGDHCGLDPFANTRFREPSARMIHSVLSYLSSILLTHR